MQNYYVEVENYVKRCEVNKKARRYEEENDKVITYWNIGRLIVEAQGGKRAKYGDELIKEWSVKLTAKYGKGYDYTNLSRFRKFYLLFPILGTMSQVLKWSQLQYIITINDELKRNYYINLCIRENLSVRELREEIKNGSYERLTTKPKSVNIIIPNKQMELKDNLKSPIIIELNAGEEIISEQDLEMHLLAKLKSFFNQLGEGFALMGNQYKVSEDGKNYYIDILLFNVNYNCYIVVELKVRELKKEDKAQIEFYMDLVDRNIKKEFHNKTLGIIISKKQDRFIAEFVGSNTIYPLLYEIKEKREKSNLK